MASKNAYRERAGTTTGSAGVQTVESTRVDVGYRRRLQSIAWEVNKAMSGGNTRCRLYIKGHGYKHYLDTQLVPVANWLYTRNENDYLYAGESLVLELDQGQATTIVTLDLTGYEQKCEV